MIIHTKISSDVIIDTIRNYIIDHAENYSEEIAEECPEFEDYDALVETLEDPIALSSILIIKNIKEIVNVDKNGEQDIDFTLDVKIDKELLLQHYEEHLVNREILQAEYTMEDR